MLPSFFFSENIYWITYCTRHGSYEQGWDFIIVSIITNRHFWESFLSAKNVRILTRARSLQKPQWGRLSYYHHFIDVTLEFSNLLKFTQLVSGEARSWVRTVRRLNPGSWPLTLFMAKWRSQFRGESLFRSPLAMGVNGAFILVGSMVSTFPFFGQKSLVEKPSLTCLSLQYSAWSWVSHNYYLTIWPWRSASCASLRVGGRFVCVFQPKDGKLLGGLWGTMKLLKNVPWIFFP